MSRTWCVVLALAACSQPAPVAVSPGPPRGGASDASLADAESVSATSEEAAADEEDVPAVESSWVWLNDHEPPAPSERLPGGSTIHPVIELPARVAPDGSAIDVHAVLVESPPFVAMRVRGLPAVSADGRYVAHVYSPKRCCRGNGPVELALYIFDTKTGGLKSKTLLWTLDDEKRFPEGARDLDKRVAAYANVLDDRGRTANALLAGDWVTLASLETFDNNGPLALRGEGILVTTPDGLTPPVTVTQGTATRTFAGAGFRKPAPRTCPAAQVNVQLDSGYALRDRRFAIVEARQGTFAPDGCEDGLVRLLTW